MSEGECDDEQVDICSSNIESLDLDNRDPFDPRFSCDSLDLDLR